MDALPTLTVNGFTTNKAIIMLKLYEYFLSSDYSQSNIFQGKIASLKYILSEAKNTNTLVTMATNALNDMYSCYFKTVQVDINVDETDASITLDINIIATDESDTPHTLSKLIKVTDNNIIDFYDKQEDYYG